MFCGNCGTNIEDNVGFCPNCGAKVESSKTEKIEKTQQTATDFSNDGVSTAGFSATEADVTPNFDLEQKPKRKFPRKLLFIGIPAIVIVAAIVLNMWAIVGFAIKTFGSDSDYLRYVESRAISSYCDTFSTIYSSYLLENADMKVGEKAEVSVNITDEGSDVLSELTGDQFDLDWLKEVKLDIESNINGNQDLKMGLDISGKDIISLDFVNDLQNGMMYIAIPEISEKYLSTEFETDEMSNLLSKMEDLEEVLPSEKELSKMLTKYVEIAFNTIDDAEMFKDTLEIGGVEQKCTVIELEIDERLGYEMSKNILEEAQNDEKLKTLLSDICDIMASVDSSYEYIDVDEIFSDGIDEALDEINEELNYLDGDGEVLGTLTDYVDGNHDIIAREFTTEDEEEPIFFCGKAKKGSKVAYQLSVGEDLVISGEGKESMAAITADFEVYSDGEEVLLFETEKLKVNELAKGNIKGKVTLKPGSAMAEYASSSAPVSVLDLALELNFDTSSQKAKTEISLFEDDQELIEISIDAKTQSPNKINVPDSGDAVDLTDEDELADYVDSMDTDSVIENLRKAGVSDDIIDEIENAIDELRDSMN